MLQKIWVLNILSCLRRDMKTTPFLPQNKGKSETETTTSEIELSCTAFPSLLMFLASWYSYSHVVLSHITAELDCVKNNTWHKWWYATSEIRIKKIPVSMTSSLSEESKLPCCEQPCGEAYMVRNRNLWSQPIRNWRLLTTTWGKLKWILQLWSTSPAEKLSAVSEETVSQNHVAKPRPDFWCVETVWDDAHFYYKMLYFGVICQIVVYN